MTICLASARKDNGDLFRIAERTKIRREDKSREKKLESRVIVIKDHKRNSSLCVSTQT